MIDVLDRRKRKTTRVMAEKGRYFVSRVVNGEPEYLQRDGKTWSEEQGPGWETAKEAQAAAEPYWATSLPAFHASMDMDMLVNVIDEANYPTEGYLAVWLWDTLSRLAGPAPSVASQIYQDLGYEPFSGYPLKRAAQ